MTEIEILDNLKSLGLTDYESKAYLQLLGRESLTASEVAQLSRVPRQKIYDTLNNLIQMGLCGLRLGRVKKYVAADPEKALGQLAKIFAEEQRRKEEIAKALAQRLRRLYDQGQNEVAPLEYFEVLKEKRQIIEKFLEFQKNAKKEIVAFVKTPLAITLPELEEEFEAIHRGVSIRTIYEYEEMLQDENLLIVVEKGVQGGEEARFVKALPIKFAVFDKEKVMLALVDPTQYKISWTALVCTHPGLAQVFGLLFEHTWVNALCWEEFEKMARGRGVGPGVRSIHLAY